MPMCRSEDYAQPNPSSSPKRKAQSIFIDSYLPPSPKRTCGYAQPSVFYPDTNIEESFGIMGLANVLNMMRQICLTVPARIMTPSITDSAQFDKVMLPIMNGAVVIQQLNIINNSTIQRDTNTTTSGNLSTASDCSDPLFSIKHKSVTKPPSKPTKDEVSDHKKFRIITTHFEITSNPNDKVDLSDIRLALKKHNAKNGNITPSKVIQLLSKYSVNYPKTATAESTRVDNERIHHIPYLRKLQQ